MLKYLLYTAEQPNYGKRPKINNKKSGKKIARFSSRHRMTMEILSQKSDKAKVKDVDRSAAIC